MKALLDKKSDTLLSIFDSLKIPVFIVSEKQRIVGLNSAASAVFELSADEAAESDLSMIIPFDHELIAKVSRLPLSGLSGYRRDRIQDGISIESSCRKKNKEMFIAKVSVIPCDGDSLLSLVVIQDISGQKMLQKRAAQRTKELSIFNTFAKILTRQKDIAGIMEETIEMLLVLMQADGGWICLINDETSQLSLVVKKGATDDLCSGGEGAGHAEYFSGKVFSSAMPLLVKNASEDPRVTCRDGRIMSMAGIPVMSKGVIFGVLGVSSRRLSYFTSMDIQLLKTIGSQLGIAIENSKLIKQLHAKVRHIKLINELSGIVNSSLSAGTVFRIMMQEIGKLIDYDRGSILLYDEKRDNLIIFALDTGMKTVLKKGIIAPTGSTSAGWVLKNNRSFINYDLASDLRFFNDRKLLDEGIRSTISVPLFQDKVIGVFNLDSTEPFKYSENDLELLLPVARHISIALENALLFEEISKEKKEWERTFDAITDMVWIEDGEGGVIRANHALLARTGFSAFNVGGRKCKEVLNRIGILNAPCLYKKETSSAGKPSFKEFKGTGGAIFHFWSYPLIDDEGRLYAIVHYLKDVTSQRLLEQQLIRTDKLASLGTLVAGIAHEINNPLGIIAGYSEALIERSHDKELLKAKEFEDFPEYLGTIHNEIFRCKEILQSLLEFARPHGVTFRELDVNELIKEVILLVNHKAARLKHNIELFLNRDLPPICGDAGSLRQLFMNIIINSLYFTPEGGSIVIISEMDSDSGDQRFGSDVHRLKVVIKDTGSGIPANIIDRIFDPFVTTKPVGEGTGLGLAISYKIVEEHGGSIDVESEAGKGTRFTIKFKGKNTDGKSTCN